MIFNEIDVPRGDGDELWILGRDFYSVRDLWPASP